MANPKEVSKSDYELLAEFRYLLRRFMAFSEHEARSAGLAPQQHQALLAIAGTPDGEIATVGRIAERLQIAQHSAVGLVNRLESEGFVARSRDDHDQRRVHVDLTDKGWAVLGRLSAAHHEEIDTLAPTLTDLLVKLRKPA